MSKPYEEYPLNHESPRFSLDFTDDEEEEGPESIKLQELSSLLHSKHPQQVNQQDLLSPLSRLNSDKAIDLGGNIHISTPVDFEQPHSQLWDSLRPTRPFGRRRRGHPWRRPYMPMSGGEGRSRCYCYYKLGILVVIAFTVFYAAIMGERTVKGSTWPKWDQVRSICVLYFSFENGFNGSGDSYSTFGQREDGSSSVVQHFGKNSPSADSSATWNWNNKSTVAVYDYSVNTYGITVSGVSEQINQFIPSVNHAPWKRNSTLFNIIQNLDAEVQLTQLFDLQEQLYAVGARNFLLLNVPPFDRAPDAENKDRTPVIDTWNTMLLLHAKDFQQRHLNDESVIKIYNANLYFNKILNDPKAVGFEDVVGECDTGECIWTDDFYPSSSMHKLLAKDLAGFLS